MVDYLKYLRYCGITAVVFAWLVITISIYLNPWFNFFRNAFSDLGSPSANYPFVYNYGLVITAIMIGLYSIYLMAYSRNKVETVGASFFLVASIFLALIGIFHEGTYPHVFVSLWFFIQSGMAVLIWGMGALLEKLRVGLYSILIVIIASILAIIVKWPSGATLETLGILTIDLWAILTYVQVR